MFIQASPIDEHLAKRLRAIRTTCGVTQSELGELVGVTFQQIQKYESASNKISASRLYEICRVLNKPLNSFFDDILVEQGYYNFEFTPEKQVIFEDQAKNKEITSLVKVFNKIEDEELRLNIVNLVDAIIKAK
jgi:transcriptional regulator with XRE-family HTH domain